MKKKPDLIKVKPKKPKTKGKFRPTRPKEVGEDKITIAFNGLNIGEPFLFTSGTPVPMNGKAFIKKSINGYNDGSVQLFCDTLSAQVYTNKKRIGA